MTRNELKTGSLGDEELMVAYQMGREDAFRVLYDRHHARVYGFLLNHLKDRSLADDAFQAAFLKLHQNRARYNASFPFLPWLFTVTRTAMLDVLRARKRVSANETQDALALAQAIQPEAAIRSGAELLGMEASRPALEALPVQQREALQLRYGQDLSFEEIAGRLHTSPQNSRQLVSRALKALRKLLPSTSTSKGGSS